MGYYTGTGVVSGGGESTSVAMSFVYHGAHNWYQKDTSSTTTKNGVSLATAQAATGDCSMTTASQSWTTSGATCTSYFPNGYGTKSESMYSRIGDSNLYTVATTSHTIKCKMDNYSWQG